MVVAGDVVVMRSVVVVDGAFVVIVVVAVVVDVAIDVLVVSVGVVIAVVVEGSGGNVAFKSENRAQNSIN